MLATQIRRLTLYLHTVSSAPLQELWLKSTDGHELRELASSDRNGRPAAHSVKPAHHTPSRLRLIFLDDLQPGASYTTVRRTITEADIVGFAGLSGDFNPLHTDEVFARDETPFGSRIAHGLLGVSVGSGLRGPLDDLHVLAFLEVRRRFVAPIYAGDTLHARYTVSSTRRSERNPDRGVVVLGVELVKQDGTTAQMGEDVVLVGVREDGLTDA